MRETKRACFSLGTIAQRVPFPPSYSSKFSIDFSVSGSTVLTHLSRGHVLPRDAKLYRSETQILQLANAVLKVRLGYSSNMVVIKCTTSSIRSSARSLELQHYLRSVSMVDADYVKSVAVTSSSSSAGSCSISDSPLDGLDFDMAEL
jgi:hypothetical protein